MCIYSPIICADTKLCTLMIFIGLCCLSTSTTPINTYLAHVKQYWNERKVLSGKSKNLAQTNLKRHGLFLPQAWCGMG